MYPQHFFFHSCTFRSISVLLHHSFSFLSFLFISFCLRTTLFVFRIKCMFSLSRSLSLFSPNFPLQMLRFIWIHNAVVSVWCDHYFCHHGYDKQIHFDKNGLSSIMKIGKYFDKPTTNKFHAIHNRIRTNLAEKYILLMHNKIVNGNKWHDKLCTDFSLLFIARHEYKKE